MEVEPFQLCATLAGHEQDVRAVGALPDGALITGSRDSTVRIWRAADDAGTAYACTGTLQGHTHFVGAVAAVPGGGVASGSNDKHVIDWNVETGVPSRVLEGHTDVVSCVVAARGQVFSASWDKTARVWQEGACISTLTGHEAAVWSVLPLGDESGLVLTASADRTVKLWQGDECVRTFSGHGDVVRSLAEVPGVGFLSGSNDGTVRLWDLGGECLRVVQVSDTFVYSVGVLGTGEWYTCSEDRTVRVWDSSTGECAQSIMHPSTVWATCALPNGDLAAGCADGNGYVWTRRAERVAHPDALAAFKELVAAVEVPAQHMEGSGIDTANMAGEEALAEPGTREGQHKMVKDATTGKPMLYQWSNANKSWEKIGEITGSDGGGATMGKKVFEGKEWDYLFDIDMEGAMLKLPFNRGDDPWMAAQQWIWKHGFDQGNLDQIANHIIKNTPGNVVASTSGNVDPFTSSGAYRPGAAPSAGGGGGTTNVDPFTSGGAYRPTYTTPAAAAPSRPPTEDPLSAKRYRPGDAAAAQSSAAAVAQLPFLTFDAAKHDALLAKLAEFNGLVAADDDGAVQALALSTDELAQLAPLMGTLKARTMYHASKIDAKQLALFTGAGAARPGLLGWPPSRLFPALDFLRLLVLHPAATPHIAALSPPLLPRLVALLQPAPDGAPTDKAVVLMVLRAFANLAHSSESRKLLSADASSVLDTLPAPMESGSTGARLAACTVLLNVSSMLKEASSSPAPSLSPGGVEALSSQALSLCTHALALEPMVSPAEEEALFRVLAALAAFLDLGASALSLAKSLGLGEQLSALSLPETAAAKVKDSRAQLVAKLA